MKENAADIWERSEIRFLCSETYPAVGLFAETTSHDRKATRP